MAYSKFRTRVTMQVPVLGITVFVVRSARGPAAEKPVKISDDVPSYAAGCEQDDDLTMITVKVTE